MSFVIHHRHGNSETAQYISDAMIADLLSELDVDRDDVEHGDVWLSESLSAWTLGVFAGDRHLIVLDNTDPGGDAFPRADVSRQDAFALLRRVANGEMAAIRAETWYPGYGS